MNQARVCVFSVCIFRQYLKKQKNIVTHTLHRYDVKK